MAQSYEIGLIMAAMGGAGVSPSKLFSPPSKKSGPQKVKAAADAEAEVPLRYSTDSESLMKGVIPFPCLGLIPARTSG